MMMSGRFTYRTTQFLRTLVMGTTLAAGSACSDIGTTPGGATVRFANAIPDAGTLSFSSSNQVLGSNLLFQGISNCTAVAPGTATFSFGPQGQSPIATTGAIILASGQKYTVVATGTSATPSYVILTTNASATPAAGHALLSVVNTIPNSGNIDVYVGTPNAPLDTAVAKNIALNAAAYVNVTAGAALEVWLTATGTQAVIANTTIPLTFSSGQSSTLVFAGPAPRSTSNSFFLIPACP